MRTWTIPTAGVLAVIAGATAEAAPIVFTAADPSAGPGMPFPNSAAEAATFDAAASGARTLVTVESASAGPVHQPADSAGGDDAGSFGDIIGMDDVRFFAAAAAVPEPTSLALLGMGLAGFGLLRRRYGVSRAMTRLLPSPDSRHSAGKIAFPVRQ